jgi:hypothetical protein
MTTFIVTHDIDTSRETTEVEAQSFAGDTANGITFYDERGQACAWFEAHRVYKVVQKTENNAPITELNPRQAHAEAVRETVLTAVRDTPPASHDDALDPPLPTDRITWVRRDHTITELYPDSSYGAMILDVTPFLAGGSSEWVTDVDRALSWITAAHRQPRQVRWVKSDRLTITEDFGPRNLVIDISDLMRGSTTDTVEGASQMLSDLVAQHNETVPVPVPTDA